MRTKGIGPNNLGAPKGVGKMMKSPAKQVNKNKQNYRDLRPKDAGTYADSLSVEAGHFGGRSIGEVAGKIASGGTQNRDPARGFTQGNTPNSAEAEKMMKDNRNSIKKTGGNYLDAYRR